MSHAEERARPIVIGDVVYLASGSPPFRVVETDGNYTIVQWWGGEDGLQMAMFPAVCLQHEMKLGSSPRLQVVR